MNFQLLPDMLAIGVLVAVFRSILARRPDVRAQHWFAGWIFILFHFIAELLDSGNGIEHRIMLSVSLVMLVLAAQAFMSFAMAGDMPHRSFSLFGSMLTLPYIVYIVSDCWGVSAVWVYYLLAAVALPGGLLCLRRISRSTPLPRYAYLCIILLRLLLFPVIHYFTADVGVVWILFDAYLIAAIMQPIYTERRPGTGMWVTMCSFIAWALVFPTEQLLAMYAPTLHVESEVWNLPIFLVAIGMILVMLENQVNHHEYLALHDELTGLPNRRLYEDRLQQALDRALRLDRHVALLYIDLNRFKNVNDTFGHQAGDQFLKIVAQRFQQVVRRADTIARTGGDEFSAVICDLPSRDAADTVVRSLQQCLQEPVLIDGWAVPISASIGMALSDEDGATKAALAAAADTAMYSAKLKARTLEEQLRNDGSAAPRDLEPRMGHSVLR